MTWIVLRKIEIQYGKAGQIWLLDRGIPTEDVLFRPALSR